MAEEKKPPKVTKASQVKDHLIEHKHLTSWEAITKYKATRLAAIIFNLRADGYVITSTPQEGLDVNGNNSNWVRYDLISEPSEAALKKKLEEKKKAKVKKPKEDKPAAEEILSNIPSDKNVVLRPKHYKKGDEKESRKFSGKEIIQVNLFDNANTEI